MLFQANILFGTHTKEMNYYYCYSEQLSLSEYGDMLDKIRQICY